MRKSNDILALTPEMLETLKERFGESIDLNADIPALKELTSSLGDPISADSLKLADYDRDYNRGYDRVDYDRVYDRFDRENGNPENSPSNTAAGINEEMLSALEERLAERSKLSHNPTSADIVRSQDSAKNEETQNLSATFFTSKL